MSSVTNAKAVFFNLMFDYIYMGILNVRDFHKSQQLVESLMCTSHFHY